MEMIYTHIKKMSLYQYRIFTNIELETLCVIQVSHEQRRTFIVYKQL